jgi:hypothetical protein
MLGNRLEHSSLVCSKAPLACGHLEGGDNLFGTTDQIGAIRIVPQRVEQEHPA